MVSNPNSIIYSCIARKTTILTEFSSSSSIEPRIEAIAQQCIEKTPPNHSFFSHTIHKRTYTFLIETPFTYFAIFDQGLSKSDFLAFFNRLKSAFEKFRQSKSINGVDDLASLCFQDPFHATFRKVVGFDADSLNSIPEEWSGVRDSSSLDLSQGKVAIVRPLLSKPIKAYMKKKKRFLDGEVDGGDHHHLENHSNGSEDANGVFGKDVSVAMNHKSSGGGGGGVYLSGDGKQKAKQAWRKHVWVVLILDLAVCAILFGIWLWVCSGFECIER